MKYVSHLLGWDVGTHIHTFMSYSFTQNHCLIAHSLKTLHSCLITLTCVWPLNILTNGTMRYPVQLEVWQPAFQWHLWYYGQLLIPISHWNASNLTKRTVLPCWVVLLYIQDKFWITWCQYYFLLYIWLSIVTRVTRYGYIVHVKTCVTYNRLHLLTQGGTSILYKLVPVDCRCLINDLFVTLWGDTMASAMAQVLWQSCIRHSNSSGI